MNKVCMTTIEFPKSNLKLREEYPCFNNFETRIDQIKSNLFLYNIQHNIYVYIITLLQFKIYKSIMIVNV